MSEKEECIAGCREIIARFRNVDDETRARWLAMVNRAESPEDIWVVTHQMNEITMGREADRNLVRLFTVVVSNMVPHCWQHGRGARPDRARFMEIGSSLRTHCPLPLFQEQKIEGLLKEGLDCRVLLGGKQL
jgi:hypothetical protein